MNSVPFRHFNRREFNIFFAIVSRMRDKGTKDVQFSYKYLMKISGTNYGRRTNRFVRDLESTSRKLQRLSIYRNNAHEYVNWILFPGFRIDKDNHIVHVSVNPKLEGVLNNLVNWTRFSLAQFTRLKSSYSKTMFRLIKQYRTTGYLNLPTKKFRTLMCVPKSYDNNAILRRVIKPIEVELTPMIRGLSITRQHSGRGGRITGYIFTFHPESPKQDDFSKGWFSEEHLMLTNLDLNDDIRPSWKKESRRRIKEIFDPTAQLAKKSRKRKRKKVKINPLKNIKSKSHSEPKDVFQRILKGSPVNVLRMYLKMYQAHFKTVHFSKTQAKALRKEISKRSRKRK